MSEHERNWLALRGYWPSFCEKYPALTLNRTPDGLVYFNRKYATTLIEKGVVKKLPNGRLIADADLFDKAAFEILTGAA